MIYMTPLMITSFGSTRNNHSRLSLQESIPIRMFLHSFDPASAQDG